MQHLQIENKTSTKKYILLPTISFYLLKKRVSLHSIIFTRRLKMGNIQNELMVTVRCITYNQEAYIRKCLEGIVMQRTNFRFEAIVHDDASTDHTPSIIQEFAEKYPDIIKPIFETENQYSKQDGSLGKIMNAHTHGKYVAICEGDDYWIDPDKLQKQVDFLEENPDYGLVHTMYQTTDVTTGTINRTMLPYIDGQPIDDILLGNCYIATLTACYRRELLDKIGTDYQKQGFLMGDFPLWLEILKLTKIKCIPDFTANYNIVPQSATHQKEDKKRLAFAVSVRDIRLYYVKRFNLNHLFRTVYCDWLFYKSMEKALNGDNFKSIYLFIKSHMYKRRNRRMFKKALFHKKYREF